MEITENSEDNNGCGNIEAQEPSMVFHEQMTCSWTYYSNEHINPEISDSK